MLWVSALLLFSAPALLWLFVRRGSARPWLSSFRGLRGGQGYSTPDHRALQDRGVLSLRLRGGAASSHHSTSRESMASAQHTATQGQPRLETGLRLEAQDAAEPSMVPTSNLAFAAFTNFGGVRSDEQRHSQTCSSTNSSSSTLPRLARGYQPPEAPCLDLLAAVQPALQSRALAVAPPSPRQQLMRQGSKPGIGSALISMLSHDSHSPVQHGDLYRSRLFHAYASGKVYIDPATAARPPDITQSLAEAVGRALSFAGSRVFPLIPVVSHAQAVCVQRERHLLSSLSLLANHPHSSNQTTAAAAQQLNCLYDGVLDVLQQAVCDGLGHEEPSGLPPVTLDLVVSVQSPGGDLTFQPRHASRCAAPNMRLSVRPANLSGATWIWPVCIAPASPVDSDLGTPMTITLSPSMAAAFGLGSKVRVLLVTGAGHPVVDSICEVESSSSSSSASSLSFSPLVRVTSSQIASSQTTMHPAPAPEMCQIIKVHIMEVPAVMVDSTQSASSAQPLAGSLHLHMLPVAELYEPTAALPNDGHLVAVGSILVAAPEVQQEMQSYAQWAVQATAEQQEQGGETSRGEALATDAIAWRHHLQPFVSDICFLLDTAPAVRAAIHGTGNAPHTTPESQSMFAPSSESATAQATAWTGLASDLLRFCISRQLPSLVQVVLSAASTAGVRITCGPRDATYHDVHQLLAETVGVFQSHTASAPTGAGKAAQSGSMDRPDVRQLASGEVRPLLLAARDSATQSEGTISHPGYLGSPIGSQAESPPSSSLLPGSHRTHTSSSSHEPLARTAVAMTPSGTCGSTVSSNSVMAIPAHWSESAPITQPPNPATATAVSVAARGLARFVLPPQYQAQPTAVMVVNVGALGLAVASLAGLLTWSTREDASPQAKNLGLGPSVARTGILTPRFSMVEAVVVFVAGGAAHWLFVTLPRVLPSMENIQSVVLSWLVLAAVRAIAVLQQFVQSAEGIGSVQRRTSPSTSSEQSSEGPPEKQQRLASESSSDCSLCPTPSAASNPTPAASAPPTNTSSARLTTSAPSSSISINTSSTPWHGTSTPPSSDIVNVKMPSIKAASLSHPDMRGRPWLAQSASPRAAMPRIKKPDGCARPRGRGSPSSVTRSSSALSAHSRLGAAPLSGREASISASPHATQQMLLTAPIREQQQPQRPSNQAVPTTVTVQPSTPPAVDNGASPATGSRDTAGSSEPRMPVVTPHVLRCKLLVLEQSLLSVTDHLQQHNITSGSMFARLHSVSGEDHVVQSDVLQRLSSAAHDRSQRASLDSAPGDKDSWLSTRPLPWRARAVPSQQRLINQNMFGTASRRQRLAHLRAVADSAAVAFGWNILPVANVVLGPADTASGELPRSAHNTTTSTPRATCMSLNGSFSEDESRGATHHGLRRTVSFSVASLEQWKNFISAVQPTGPVENPSPAALQVTSPSGSSSLHQSSSNNNDIGIHSEGQSDTTVASSLTAPPLLLTLSPPGSPLVDSKSHLASSSRSSSMPPLPASPTLVPDSLPKPKHQVLGVSPVIVSTAECVVPGYVEVSAVLLISRDARLRKHRSPKFPGHAHSCTVVDDLCSSGLTMLERSDLTGPAAKKGLVVRTMSSPVHRELPDVLNKSMMGLEDIVDRLELGAVAQELDLLVLQPYRRKDDVDRQCNGYPEMELDVLLVDVQTCQHQAPHLMPRLWPAPDTCTTVHPFTRTGATTNAALVQPKSKTQRDVPTHASGESPASHFARNLSRNNQSKQRTVSVLSPTLSRSVLFMRRVDEDRPLDLTPATSEQIPPATARQQLQLSPAASAPCPNVSPLASRDMVDARQMTSSDDLAAGSQSQSAAVQVPRQRRSQVARHLHKINPEAFGSGSDRRSSNGSVADVNLEHPTLQDCKELPVEEQGSGGSGSALNPPSTPSFSIVAREPSSDVRTQQQCGRGSQVPGTPTTRTNPAAQPPYSHNAPNTGMLLNRLLEPTVRQPLAPFTDFTSTTDIHRSPSPPLFYVESGSEDRGSEDGKGFRPGHLSPPDARMTPRHSSLETNVSEPQMSWSFTQQAWTYAARNSPWLDPSSVEHDMRPARGGDAAIAAWSAGVTPQSNISSASAPSGRMRPSTPARAVQASTSAPNTVSPATHSPPPYLIIPDPDQPLGVPPVATPSLADALSPSPFNTFSQGYFPGMPPHTPLTHSLLEAVAGSDRLNLGRRVSDGVSGLAQAMTPHRGNSVDAAMVPGSIPAASRRGFISEDNLATARHGVTPWDSVPTTLEHLEEASRPLSHQAVVAAAVAVAAAGGDVLPPSPGRIRLLPPPSPLMKAEARMSQQLFGHSPVPMSPFRQSFHDLQQHYEDYTAPHGNGYEDLQQQQQRIQERQRRRDLVFAGGPHSGGSSLWDNGPGSSNHRAAMLLSPNHGMVLDHASTYSSPPPPEDVFPFFLPCGSAFAPAGPSGPGNAATSPLLFEDWTQAAARSGADARAMLSQALGSAALVSSSSGQTGRISLNDGSLAREFSLSQPLHLPDPPGQLVVCTSRRTSQQISSPSQLPSPPFSSAAPTPHLSCVMLPYSPTAIPPIPPSPRPSSFTPRAAPAPLQGFLLSREQQGAGSTGATGASVPLDHPHGELGGTMADVLRPTGNTGRLWTANSAPSRYQDNIYSTYGSSDITALSGPVNILQGTQPEHVGEAAGEPEGGHQVSWSYLVGDAAHGRMSPWLAMSDSDDAADEPDESRPPAVNVEALLPAQHADSIISRVSNILANPMGESPEPAEMVDGMLFPPDVMPFSSSLTSNPPISRPLPSVAPRHATTFSQLAAAMAMAGTMPSPGRLVSANASVGGGRSQPAGMVHSVYVATPASSSAGLVEHGSELETMLAGTLRTGSHMLPPPSPRISIHTSRSAPTAHPVVVMTHSAPASWQATALSLPSSTAPFPPASRAQPMPPASPFAAHASVQLPTSQMLASASPSPDGDASVTPTRKRHWLMEGPGSGATTATARSQPSCAAASSAAHAGSVQQHAAVAVIPKGLEGMCVRGIAAQLHGEYRAARCRILVRQECLAGLVHPAGDTAAARSPEVAEAAVAATSSARVTPACLTAQAAVQEASRWKPAADLTAVLSNPSCVCVRWRVLGCCEQ